MPLFRYFVVVGSVLLGLLFVAEAQLGPPRSLNVSTNFHGLPAPWKAAATNPILTVREGVAPDMTFAQAAPAQQTAKLAGEPTGEKEKKAKKPRKVVRHNASRDLFAHSTARPGPGIFW